MMSKRGKNKEVAHEPQVSVSLMFLPHFDVFCDLLLNIPTETWNLFVLYNDQKRKKTFRHTCLIPLDLCYFRHFLSPKQYFSSLLLLFFLYLTCKTLFSKCFSTSSPAQRRIMANFAKQRVSRGDDTQ